MITARPFTADGVRISRRRKKINCQSQKSAAGEGPQRAGTSEQQGEQESAHHQQREIAVEGAVGRGPHSAQMKDEHRQHQQKRPSQNQHPKQTRTTRGTDGNGGTNTISNNSSRTRHARNVNASRATNTTCSTRCARNTGTRPFNKTGNPGGGHQHGKADQRRPSEADERGLVDASALQAEAQPCAYRVYY